MTSRRSILAGLGAAAVGFILSGGAQAAGKKLNFLNWDTYIGDTTLKDFRRETGVEVDMYFFQTNDELFARMKGGDSGFDVIVPSDDNLSHMIAANLLQPLDHQRLPNFANIDPAFRNPPYDPGCRYAMPFSWLMLGIGYRKSIMRAGAVPDSWGWLFDSNIYDGNVALVGDPLPLFTAASLYLGHGADGLTPQVISDIEALLKRRNATYHQDDGQDRLLAGEVELVMEYNGDIAQVISIEASVLADGDLGFVVPKEGGLLAADSWAIPANAPNPEAAHAFLNFMLSVEGGRDIIKTIMYPTPNAAVRAAMPQSYRDSPVLFPPLGASAFAKRPGDDIVALVEAAWSRVMDEAE
ncbi:hypothetical protein ABAC460_03190 [Asticcacaulis sp. AC460]|uniref:ABC transporter substrate-binding protein n=1 Tax=Asticcacaulis sp. AC460 TaxID=1282360 RepID=UPI0003C402EF|nr:spermidine/putrescine ABC transporter substrate-binding protein [Asticcacaulis sp. AC460]ESQ91915.1 hypothetical protein ABAC460_03190 [Asticcacaulis sp. AC460]